MVSDVRQRVLREQLGRSGVIVDPAWARRRLPLRGGDHLSDKVRARLRTVFATGDPTEAIAAAGREGTAPATAHRTPTDPGTAAPRPAIGGPGS